MSIKISFRSLINKALQRAEVLEYETKSGAHYVHPLGSGYQTPPTVRNGDHIARFHGDSDDARILEFRGVTTPGRGYEFRVPQRGDVVSTYGSVEGRNEWGNPNPITTVNYLWGLDAAKARQRFRDLEAHLKRRGVATLPV